MLGGKDLDETPPSNQLDSSLAPSVSLIRDWDLQPVSDLVGEKATRNPLVLRWSVLLEVIKVKKWGCFPLTHHLGVTLVMVK